MNRRAAMISAAKLEREMFSKDSSVSLNEAFFQIRSVGFVPKVVFFYGEMVISPEELGELLTNWDGITIGVSISHPAVVTTLYYQDP